MRSTLLLSLGLFLSSPTLAGEPIRLAVMLVSDQFRADYLDRFASRTSGGFARLIKEGALWTEARQGQVPVETAPGHAALSTGRWPAQHGIVANEWWDRRLGRLAYVSEDPDLGRSPENLLSPTLGDLLKARSPDSRVLSLAGKDRAAILLGGRRADLAAWYDSAAGRFVSSAYYPRPPAWLDAYNRTLGPEGALPAEERRKVRLSPRWDRLLLGLARAALAEDHLGRGPAADLLLISFSGTDSIGHYYGPATAEHDAQLESLDKLLGELFSALDARIGRGRYVLAFASDHGVLPAPETPAGKAAGGRRVHYTRTVAALEEALSRKWPRSPGHEGRWVLSFLPPHLYLNRSLAAQMGLDRRRWVQEAASAAARLEIVAAACPLERAEGCGAARPEWSFVPRSVFAPRSGDVLVLLKPGVLLMDEPTGTSHGLPYDYDTRIPLALAGPGVKPGRYAGPAWAVDLAPTLARLLGLDMAPAQGGRILEEGLAAAGQPAR